MKRAFSLVELSIVLIIIGLLVAGVSGGSKLIESAKLNKVIGEVNQMNLAVKTFKLMYDALPGDFSEAEDYWGTEVTNGDDDGKIAWSVESRNGFVHLSKAEIIVEQTWNQNAFKLGVFKAQMIFINPSAGGHSGYFLDTQDTNLMQVAGPASVNNSVFIPYQLYKIDKKIDDGLPKSGIVTFRNAAPSTDATCTNTSTNYKLTSKILGCSAVFALDQ